MDILCQDEVRELSGMGTLKWITLVSPSHERCSKTKEYVSKSVVLQENPQGIYDYCRSRST